MGCDIHCYREQLEDDKWVCKQPMTNDDVEEGKILADSTYVGRDYWLFGLLSKGVRKGWSEGVAFDSKATTNRLLPDDVSPEVKVVWDEIWNGDGHSNNWLTLAEIKEKQAMLLLESGEDFEILRDSLAFFREAVFEPTDDPETTRVVFWFDN